MVRVILSHHQSVSILNSLCVEAQSDARAREGSGEQVLPVYVRCAPFFFSNQRRDFDQRHWMLFQDFRLRLFCVLSKISSGWWINACHLRSNTDAYESKRHNFF